MHSIKTWIFKGLIQFNSIFLKLTEQQILRCSWNKVNTIIHGFPAYCLIYLNVILLYCLGMSVFHVTADDLKLMI